MRYGSLSERCEGFTGTAHVSKCIESFSDISDEAIWYAFHVYFEEVHLDRPALWLLRLDIYNSEVNKSNYSS